MSGVVTVGETMGLFTATEPGRLAGSFRLGIGGAESNVAIGIARLGGSSTWMGRLGADAVGDLIRRELAAEGVRVSATTDPGAPTGVMVKTRPVTAVTRVDYHRASSAGSRLDPADIDADSIRRASVLHITGITPALSDTAAATIDHVVDLATAAGVPVSFDVNHRPTLWRGRTPRESYLRVVRRAQIVFASEEEARLLVPGDSPLDLARRIAALGPTEVLIRRGEQGAVAWIAGDESEVPATPIVPVDTVGAGDAFTAGYLAERLAGADVPTRLRTAARAGAFACLGPGDWESLPRRSDLALLDAGDAVLR